MSFSNMTLEELARHIGMDARDVKKLADRGKLPGRNIGGEWRFNRAELLEWLQHEMHFLDVRDLLNLERAMTETPDEVAISRFVFPEAIEPHLPARSKPSVPRELARVAERTGLVYDAAGLCDALEQREALHSTALPGGFAFPHPRRPDPYFSAQPLVVIARVPQGIPFGAMDGRLTDVFVMVCCHDERQHLHALARLSMLFASQLADEIRDAGDDVDQIVKALVECERGLLGRRR